MTDRIRVLHVPKTGGTWVTEAMRAAGVSALPSARCAAHSDLVASASYGDRFTIAFIRHPLDFWRSYWAFRVHTGWDLSDEIDRAVRCDDFVQFIERVITVVPGAAGQIFDRFVGSVGYEIDFVGRHERLVDDLCQALRIAGEPFDERTLRAHPPVNTGNYSRGRALYPRPLAERLAEAESSTISRFYPWEPVPERLIAGARVGAPNALSRELEAAFLQRRDAQAELGLVRRALAVSERELAATRDAIHQVEQSHLWRVTLIVRRLRDHFRRPRVVARVNTGPSHSSGASASRLDATR